MTTPAISLPPPKEDGEMSLERAIRLRRSIRSFQVAPVDEDALGQILWGAQGLRGENGFRTVPSAGALYPLEVIAVTGSGMFKYKPQTHSLLRIKRGDYRPILARAALNQEFITQAPLTLIFTAKPSRMVSRYGEARSPRYIQIEVGHAAQNAMLQATALGLGSVAVGAFHDDEVAKLLELTAESIPLYLVSVGYPV